MKRLTKQKLTNCDLCNYQDACGDYGKDECSEAMLYDRLSRYEDILFDESGNEIIPLDRLSEICQAEREQRCVVLPCKVGDTVYDPSGKTGIITSIHQNLVGKTAGRWIVTAWYENYYGDSKSAGFNAGAHKCYTIDDFGKTVFLTRAEAALAEKGE